MVDGELDHHIAWNSSTDNLIFSTTFCLPRELSGTNFREVEEER